MIYSLSHTELHSSHKQSHSFPSLPAHTTMASSQGTPFSRWASHDIFPFTHRTAQFTQAIPQFPQFTCRHHNGIISRHSIQQISIARYSPFKIPLLTAHSRFHFFFSDNIMADVASKQQTTALFLSTTITRTRRHTELAEKLTKLMGNLCCAREHSVPFFPAIYFTQLNCTVYLRVYRAL